MISDQFGSGSPTGPTGLGFDTDRPTDAGSGHDRWADRLRAIELRERERASLAPTRPPALELTTVPDAPRPVAVPQPPPSDVSGPQEDSALRWRRPTQRTEEVAARTGRTPVPGFHQAALVVISALGTGAAAFLLGGDTWGRTPMAVAALIGIPGVAAISLVTAHHRLRPQRRRSHPVVATVVGVALALASLATVSILGTWGALGVIGALVVLAWWVSSPSRGRADVRDHAGRPMAPAQTRTPWPRAAQPAFTPRASTEPASSPPAPAPALVAAPLPASMLEQMMDVFAPDLPVDLAGGAETDQAPVVQLRAVPSPEAAQRGTPGRGADATGDLLGWISDTYSPSH